MRIVLFEEAEASPSAPGGGCPEPGTQLRLDEVCCAAGPSLQLDLVRSRAGQLFAFWAIGDLLVRAHVTCG
jgi:hypothetical protein